MNRDKRGRFVAGNSIAKKGWEGLVKRRFDGDIAAARTWLGKIGKWAYAQQAGIFRAGAFRHPGTPEIFLEDFRHRLDFRLNDVNELKF